VGALRSWRAGLQTASQPKRKLRAQGVAVVVVYNTANVHSQGARVFDFYSL